MNLISVSLFQRIFPSITWRLDSTSVYLTFDDGPHPVSTAIVLDMLKERGMKATFFLVGKNVVQYPQLVKRIADEGHALGNHTYHHTAMIFRSREILQRELGRTEQVLRDIIGDTPRIFRPPYGMFDGRTVRFVKERGYRFVMWTVDSKDYTKRSPDTIFRKVISSIQKGTILLFHDNHFTQDKIASTLRPILNHLENANYRTSTLSA